ncbi:ankyrin repeat-containing domain protein [Coprinopsis sp. MPI-PUGE-AT-0042]|nr:ankyrin repeat-containing domain protein [Coprinopsis sp. MPI-PUGE-AT-0042]
MPQPRVRLKAGRKLQDRSRGQHGSQASASSPRTTALVQGNSQVQINDGSISVIGGDSHTHIHYHDIKNDLKAILLAIPNFRKIHQDTLAKATLGTGVWLLRGEKFSLWLEPNGDLKILWGSGIPGAGKTILASIVINMLEAMAKESGQRICVAYIYIRYSDRSEMTVRTVLEVLVRQMVERHSELLQVVQETYAQHIQEGTQPTEAQLLGLLQELTKQLPATFYILDALDEAPIGIQLALVKKLSSLNCKMFITSRPLKAVEAHFPDAYTFPIIAQDEDIDLHIKQKIEDNVDLQGLLAAVDSSVQEEIVKTIKQKCGGMETLDAFPTEIEEAYQQTWQRILSQNSRHAALAKYILLWVTHAQRSMTIEELQHAVATSPDDHTFKSTRLVPENTLIGLCRGLVTMDEESRLVRLVHYTAQKPCKTYSLSSTHAPHSLLAKICITHLSACGFQDTSVKSYDELDRALLADPLLAYAHDAWAFHARESTVDSTISSQLTNFVTGCHSYPQSLDGVTFAGTQSLGSPNVRTKEERETPLGLASRQGHLAAAQDLLRLPDVSINATDKNGFSPLMWASICSHEVVQVLLDDVRIQVNVRDKDGWTALMLASRQNNVEAARLLLARPDIELTPVYERLVSLLVAHPSIQVNLMDRRRWTPLMCAAHFGHKGTTELLIAHPDIDVNLGDHGWSPLMCATGQGHTSTAEALLAHADIRVNQVTNNGSSALMTAAYLGHEDIVQLLLAHPDTDPNLSNNEGQSAVYCALTNGQEGVARLLLASPRTHLSSNTITRALISVSHNGFIAIVKFLLDLPSVDVNAANEDG